MLTKLLHVNWPQTKLQLFFYPKAEITQGIFVDHDAIKLEIHLIFLNLHSHLKISFMLKE